MVWNCFFDALGLYVLVLEDYLCSSFDDASVVFPTMLGSPCGMLKY